MVLMMAELLVASMENWMVLLTVLKKVDTTAFVKERWKVVWMVLQKVLRMAVVKVWLMVA